MTESAGFHWNVWYIGPEGNRESFNIEAETAADLAERRTSVLKFMKDFGAVSDVRPPMWGNEDKPKGPSKLDKFTKGDGRAKEAAQVFESEPAEPDKSDAMLAAAQAVDPGAAEVEPDDAHKRLSKLSKYKLPEGQAAPAPVSTKAPSADTLKPSKLAKYAKPEK